MSDEADSLIALNRLPNFGIAKVRSLRRAFGMLSEALAQPAETIAALCKDIGPVLAAEAIACAHSDFSREERARAEAWKVRILTAADPEWPAALEELPSPPLCLYCLGNLKRLSQPQVAMIGTRRATCYGRDQATRFALRLASAGLVVTSGLAEGIDSASHEGALQAAALEKPGHTIAVLGAALDCIYPDSRRPLARRIIHEGGLVISEYPFGRHADKNTFPQRNRLVAALARALLVIETGARGGTLITVSQAAKLGRAIYAIPGSLNEPTFVGNHTLIAEGTAKLALSPETLIEQTFATLPLTTPTADNPPLDDLSPDERRLYEVTTTEGLSTDQLAQRSGLPLPTVMALLIALQMRRKLRPLPGGLVARPPRT